MQISFVMLILLGQNFRGDKRLSGGGKWLKGAPPAPSVGETQILDQYNRKSVICR